MTLDHQFCILLGSNQEPERNLLLAIHHLHNQLTFIQVSSVWQTPPVESSGPDYLNAAVLVKSSLDKQEVKSLVLLPMEAEMGRVRSEDKFAPRPIDLDIIVYDGQVVDPDLWQFAHRAVPVSEVLPDIYSYEGLSLKKKAAQFLEEDSIVLRPEIILSI